MSVLIKGMKMPTSCPECMMANEIVKCCLTGKTYNWGLTERPSDCPLIELPPHGRLIDADALEEHDGWLRDSMYFARESGHTHIQFIYAHDIINAPTVIEAEDGE